MVCANQVPDHATIARFRVRHEAALADLFGQVLGLCADAGLVEVGVLAADGTKLAASASNDATRSYEQIAQEVLAEAGRIDAEDEVHGEAHGDDLPEHLASRDGQRFGRPPNPHTPPAQPEGKINLTDPDCRNMKAFRGYVQRYNAQADTTEAQIVIAAEIAPDGLDFAQLDPMTTAAERELEAAGVTESPEVVLADAGYLG